MPDGGVQIDEGEAAPIVNKSASVTTAKVGDTFTYTITAKNGNKARPKAICFDVTVNSDAYGMHIENTALVSGNNTPDKERYR